MVLLLLHAKAHRRSVMIIMAEEKREGRRFFSYPSYDFYGNGEENFV